MITLKNVITILSQSMKQLEINISYISKNFCDIKVFSIKI